MISINQVSIYGERWGVWGPFDSHIQTGSYKICQHSKKRIFSIFTLILQLLTCGVVAEVVAVYFLSQKIGKHIIIKMVLTGAPIYSKSAR